MEICTSKNQRKANNQRKTVKVIAIVLCTLVGLGLIYVVAVFLFFSLFVFPTRTVQILPSPNNTHEAVLKRLDGIDLVFFVIIDGQKVYSSPDFAPNRRVVFHERIIWDKTGDIVVLEVTGKRLFGYNTQTCKALSDTELLSVEYAPEPNEWEYGFEGEWPEKRVKRGNLRQ